MPYTLYKVLDGTKYFDFKSGRFDIGLSRVDSITVESLKDLAIECAEMSNGYINDCVFETEEEAYIKSIEMNIRKLSDVYSKVTGESLNVPLGIYKLKSKR